MTLRRAFRFGRGWLADSVDVGVRERMIPRADRTVPATVYRPNPLPRRPVPGWVLLHGITRPGRAHPSLVKFARVLASSGAVVVVPEVPEWVDLHLAPDRTAPTVLAALRALDDEDAVAPGRRGLAGFSFGAPQAVLASGTPELADHIGAVVGFGGYFDLERTLRFLVCGVHEWDGRTERLRPDPYGRWVVASNYLTGVVGLEGAAPVADRLRRLAVAAGERRVESWDPAYDPVKEALRSDLAPEHRELFDLFAPPSDLDPPPHDEAAERWAHDLARAARGMDPLIEPAAHLSSRLPPVHLIHGRGDRLIPYSETLRFSQHLERRAGGLHTTVTRLFAHSTEDPFPGGLEGLTEGWKFARALQRVLGAV